MTKAGCWGVSLLCGLWWLALPAWAAGQCADDPPWQRVARDVWGWLPVAEAEISHGNAGHVAPTTVVLHGRQALLIDPGPSHAHAERVKRSLACRFGARVRWVVNTHAHAESVLGNSAFADDVARGRVEIFASEATRVAMGERCPACLDNLTRKAGERSLAGTRIVLPNRTLSAGDGLRLGGLRLRILSVEQGHTEGDLVLWDPGRRVLWAGGLVYGQRLPELAQGRVDGWLAALERLKALRPAVVVGQTVSRADAAHPLPPALSATHAYLTDLRALVLRAMDEGRQPQEAGALELPAYADRAGYVERQGFNAQRAWRELEPVWMGIGDPSAPPASSQPLGAASGSAKPVPPRPGTGRPSELDAR